MKAVVCTRYGPPEALAPEEVAEPAPKDDEVLVKVHAASVTFSSLALVSGRPFIARLAGTGLLKPKNRIPGSDIAGRVEAVGENVTRFRPGDEVFGCARGAFAEYVLARESYLAPKPANISFEKAAAVPVAAPALEKATSSHTWYWEGNVQAVAVQTLVRDGWTM